MALSKIATQGGTWFKPAQHAGAAAILVEPIRFEPDREIFGTGNRTDTMFADITIFPNDAALEGKTEPLVMESAGYSQTALVRDTQNAIGEQLAVTLGTYKTRTGNNGWRFINADDATAAKVEAYLERRDAGADDAPDF